ncbi:MAG: ATP-binding protein, partial [candidate division Zixibacteria bacterium]|nr:ATP-binding protein [candidate division Zixibacteria bacterium]
NTDLIHLTATLSDDKIALKFVYPGIPFDPTARVKDYDPGAVIKQRQKRGYGLIMINRMADGISYNRNDKDLNELHIEKYWGGLND